MGKNNQISFVGHAETRDENQYGGKLCELCSELVQMQYLQIKTGLLKWSY